MAKLGTTFDANSVDPTMPFEALPPGRYLVQIVASDVLEGEYQGRKLFDRLNLVNPNPTAVEIAQRTLSAICHATGKMQVQDSDELHLIPMTVDVKVQPPKNGYDAQNTLRYMQGEELITHLGREYYD